MRLSEPAKPSSHFDRDWPSHRSRSTRVCNDQMILYRPPWLWHPDLSDYLPIVRGKTSELIDQAVELVSSGYRTSIALPVFDEPDASIWPMTNVIQVASNDWPFSLSGRQEEAARICIDSAWSLIERLAMVACVQPNLTIDDVWEIVYPDTVTRMTANAYQLAAQAWAAMNVDIAPIYLSVFNFRGQRTAFRESCGRFDRLTPQEEMLISFAPPLASLKATGTIPVGGSSVRRNCLDVNISRSTVDTEVALATFSETIGSELERELAESWGIIENLATLLLREYSLIGEEIETVLAGGNIDSWAPLYGVTRI